MREFELLKHIYEAGAGRSARVVIGPGDDMAMVRLGSPDLLTAVDQVIDGRHFVLQSTPIDLIGRKAVMRSLSDIAAMCARPVSTLVAAALPPDFGTERAKALFDAMRAAAEEYDCPLIGGDIAFYSDSSHPLICSVTVLAEPLPRGPITRSGAKVGDTVYVTGTLGGSVTPDGLGRHLTFEPRIAEAIELAESLEGDLHAMIDISDGLGRDASHIADQSGVRIEIDAAAIPCASAAGKDWRRAAGDGEDYELLFTASAQPPAVLGADVPVTAIGRVVERIEAQRSLVSVRTADGMIPGDTLGWQHESS